VSDIFASADLVALVGGAGDLAPEWLKYRSNRIAFIAAALISSNARLPEGRDLPTGMSNRFGWWADHLRDDDYSFGSQLWFELAQKATPDRPRRLKKALEDALAPMVEDGIASAVSVEVERLAPGSYGAVVEIERVDGGGDVELRYENLWDFVGGPGPHFYE